MNKDSIPSWMLPLLVIFAIFGVSRVSLSPSSPHDDNANPTLGSKKDGKKENHEKTSGGPTHENLLFYDHDALHILRNFLNAESPSKDDRPGLKLALETSAKGTEYTVEDQSPWGEAEATRKEIFDSVTSGLREYWIESIIVGVPDPEASLLRGETDWTLDALQRAIEASTHRFTIDRFDLPWRLSTERNGDEIAEETEKRHPEDEPGLMLFKCGRDPKQKHLLVVFLVGETPTAGVHKVAFTRAVAQAIALSRLGKNSDPPPPNEENLLEFVNSYRADASGGTGKTFRKESHRKGPRRKRNDGNAPATNNIVIRVLGPHFTASATRYALATEQEWGESVSFEFISGTASAVVTDSFKGSNWSFSATVWPDFQKTAILREYLHKQFDAKNDEIAELRESNTGYGAAAEPTATTTPTPVATPAPPLQKPTVATSTPDLTERLAIPFPLHISRVRNSNTDSGDSITSRTGPWAHPFVPLSTNEKEEEDLLPPFSRTETVSNRLLLDEILATLRRQRIRFVVIRATNVEDVIFLAREIESNCPDTMIFVLASDDLFLNPDAITSLRGTVMLTTYPLLSENQEWTRLGTKPLQRIMHFPTQGAEGTYNATLALMGDFDRMLEYRSPSDHTSFCCPPLWMTSIGTDAMWPIQFFPTTKRDPNIEKASEYLFDPSRSTSKPGDATRKTFVTTRESHQLIQSDETTYQGRITRTLRFSRGSGGVFWSLLILVTYFGAVFARPNYWFWGDRTFAHTLIEADRQRKELFLLFFWAGLWVLSISLVGLATIPFAALSRSNAWAAFMSAVALSSLIAFLIPLKLLGGQTFLNVSRYPSWGFRLGLSLLIASATIAILFVSISVFLVKCHFSNPGLINFFRLANLGSGVSTLLPLIYIDFAALIWALSNLRRLTFAERISLSTTSVAQEPGLGFSSYGFPGISSREESVNQTVCTPYLYWIPKSWHVSATTSLAVLVACFWYGLRSVGLHLFHATIEESWFYPVFWMGLIVVGVLLTWELVCVFTLWQTFRLFLDRVSGEAFLRAYRDDKDDNYRPLYSISMAYSDLTVVRLALKEAKRHCELTGWASRYLKDAQLNLADLEDARGMQKIAERRILLNGSLRSLTSIISSDPSTPAAERFLFLRVLDYCQRIGHGLRNLMFWTSGGLFLLLLAISSYQFPNNDSLLRLGWIFMLAAILTSILILVEMNRERVLSIFSGGTPGKIDWNSGFVFHVLVLAMLPLLGVLGIQFPATFQSTANWIAALFGSVPHQ